MQNIAILFLERRVPVALHLLAGTAPCCSDSLELQSTAKCPMVATDLLLIDNPFIH